MTEVTNRTPAALLIGILFFLPLPVAGQTSAAPPQARASTGLALYRELRTVGLDPARIHRIREASLDRAEIHLSFEDGAIGFTRAVDGRITGAFFVGDGILLLSPPNRVERASLALFTGAAILEEKFTAAYLRFNDDVFKELEPALRPSEEVEEFLNRWDGTVRTLADADALRLLEIFTRMPGGGTPSRVLHARVTGEVLGTFDVSFDSEAAEQVSIGQASSADGAIYYDLWASFPPRRAVPPDPETEIFRIPDYRIRARLRPPRDLEAETELTLEAAEAGRRVVIFELSRYLRVSSVALVGGNTSTPLEFIQNEALEGSQLARRGNDLIAVVLPQPLPVGSRARLRFAYAGPVMTEAGGGLMYVGARGVWYPNRGLAMSKFDLEFRYPRPWVLVATGQRTSVETREGEEIAQWVSEGPIPVAGFNLGKYWRAAAKAGDVTVAAYGARVEDALAGPRAMQLPPLPPGNTRARVLQSLPPPEPHVYAEEVAQRAARSIDWLSRRLGPFPYQSLALTQMPGSVSQGWPGMVFLSSYVFLSDEDRARRRVDSFDNVVFGRLMPIHETAHQWWGDLVGWKSYRDQWLIEALANYCALMSLEREQPAQFRLLMDRYREQLLRRSKAGAAYEAGPVTLGVRLASSKFPDGFDTVLYGRGTWMVHMLRHLLREAPARAARGSDPDDAFFAVLRGLIASHRYKKLSTSDFQSAFEAALPPPLHYEGKRSLDWFFSEWVEGRAVPRLELSEVKFSGRGDKLIAIGKVLQKDAPATLVTSIPVYAAVGAGSQVFLGRVFADGEETAFRLTAPAGTKKLLLDPNQTILSRP